MPHSDRYPVVHEFDPEEGFGPGADLVSFPASVQRKLDHAAGLLRDGDAEGGLAATHEAWTELARAEPLLFAALMAAPTGVSGVSVSRASRTVRTVQTERFALGLRYGHETQTTTEESSEERAVRFLGGTR